MQYHRKRRFCSVEIVSVSYADPEGMKKVIEENYKQSTKHAAEGGNISVK